MINQSATEQTNIEHKYPPKHGPRPKDKRKVNLTIKQRKFIKAYIKNAGNGTKSALETYDTKDYFVANDIASSNLQKPSIRNEILAGLKARHYTGDSFGDMLTKKLSEDNKINHPRYCDMYLDITGARAPIKVENTHQLKAQERVILDEMCPDD